MSERRHAGRRKSFLRGLIYFDNKNGGLDCIVRDLSDDGARLVISESVTLPETFELRIPQKSQTLRARITWRRGGEIGVGFGAAKATTSTDSGKNQDAAALAQRIVELEAEIASLRKLVKRVKREQDNGGGDVAA